MEENLTLRDAARKLGVSTATVQNWRRAGLLTALTDRSVSDFLKDRNRDSRLTSRANKRLSKRAFSPSEYGSAQSGPVLDFVREQKWGLEEALYYALEDLTDTYGKKPENPFFLREMENWADKISPKGRNKRPTYPEMVLSLEDFPGWLYQGLLHEGKKSVTGSYYTPPGLVKDLLGHVLKDGGKDTFFDPCCGTGGFLIPAARILCDPERVAGQDRDSLAVRLARLNLMRLFPHRRFEPSIYAGDSLARSHGSLKGRTFSAVATNPPWGYRFTPEQKRLLARKYGLTSGESASLFILAALDRLTEEGRASLLLPESLLHRNRHRDIRERILDRAERIDWYGRRFSRVQSECFALTLRGKGKQSEKIKIRGTGYDYDRGKSSFSDRPLQVWDIFVSPVEETLFEKLFARDHILLGEGARWGLGIVTGNNRERVSGSGKGRPILSGGDISPFAVREPKRRLDYDDGRLQQKAPLELYEEKKIVYRFIASRPVAACDGRGYLTLNSVNFLIPGEKIDPAIAVMLLNSDLYGRYFEKTFHTLKVLRGQLERLPVPLLSPGETRDFKALYPRIEKDYPGCRKELNGLVARIFGLNEKERRLIEG